MPFRSKAQMKWMYTTHPTMAKRWSRHTKNIRALPKRKAKKRGRK